MPGIDERRLELIDGDVCEKVSPRWGHATLAGELYAILRRYGSAGVEPRAIIPRGRDLDDSAPLPDVAFYRHNPPPPDDWMRTPSDVAIEIISPGQSRREMRLKVDVYLSFGVRSVWVFDLERESVDVYEDGARHTLAGADVLESKAVPELRVAVGELFDAVLRPERRPGEARPGEAD